MTSEEVIQSFYKNKNMQKSVKMSNYMKDQFLFLGIPTPLRKSLEKPFLNELKNIPAVDWSLLFLCWEKEFREFQYFAIDILTEMLHFLGPDDIPYIKRLIVTKSWWDTVDGLDHIVGSISLRYPETNDTLIHWSIDPNIWLRRVAIDHQLLRKEKTNTELFEKILVNNLDQKEFFINKAIGWSLRDYSKTNPSWVREFIRKNKDHMSTLSVKEASKYI